MLGGGTFVTQNKKLAGAYINFINKNYGGTAISDRGNVAMALPLSWGVDDAIFTVTSDDFRKNTVKIFGFAYDSAEAKGLRDLFKNATTLYCYKLMNNGAKASSAVAEALYKGAAGNKIATEILASTEEGKFDVNIYFDSEIVFTNTVSSLDELKADENGFVAWKISTLAASDKTSLTNGSNGSTITAAQHSEFLDKAQSYTFNAMGVVTDTDAIKDLYVQECKDMRDGAGVKYQLVVYNKAADYEGVVNVKNSADLVYWVTGIVAGCAVNKSNTNKVYDGEYTFTTDYTKAQLESAIDAGEFVLHKVGNDVRVLTDINSLVTLTADKGADFKSNQTIRVCDQIAMDIAAIFNNQFLGIMPNDAMGRTVLKNQIVNHHEQLQRIRAIENFSNSDVTVERGESKKSVVVTDSITVVNAMEQLYMSVVVI